MSSLPIRPPQNYLKSVVREDQRGNEIENFILLQLELAKYQLVVSRLEFVRFKPGQMVYDVGDVIKSVFFPNHVLLSVLSVQTDGRIVEVGLIGREGFVGLPVVYGFKTHPFRIIAQSEGSAYRMDASALLQLLPQLPKLERTIHRYQFIRSFEATQLAACNCLHEATQRLARWLLLSHDRLHDTVLPITQEFLAEMLGTRRATVGHSLTILQKAGAITSSRGYVNVLDRNKLERASCECYSRVKQQTRTWESQRG